MIDASKLDFQLTCGACPEQYDVMYEGKLVGYVRLRWGSLTLECPDAGDNLVYEHSWSDTFKGAFEDDCERKDFLMTIREKIKDYYGDQI